MSLEGPWQEKWINGRPLSGGGQGDTFLVEHAGGSPTLAVLKLLKESRRKDAKARSRMYREVANLRALAVAGARVPRVLDGNTEQFEDLDTVLYFVMEFISGTTLDKVIADRKKLPIALAVRLCLTLCESLRIAFKEGILHRDIKPNNLMAQDLARGEIIMLDFGLSFNEREQGSLTDASETLDNSFLSLPERRGYLEDRRDERSDLTSVSAILYYCLTGIPPRDLLDSQGRAPHRSAEASKRPVISHPAQQALTYSLLDRGLHHDINRRFQSVAELEERLLEILTPPPFPPEEDLAAIARREAQALYQADAKTRLAAYKSRAAHLGKAFDEFVKQWYKKLDPFYVTFTDLVTRAQTHRDSGDVFNYDVNVKVAEHKLMYIIKYRIIIEGSECHILRQLVARWPNNKVDSDEPVLVNRYLTENSPETPYLLQDLKDAIAEAISRLRERIAKGYEDRP